MAAGRKMSKTQLMSELAEATGTNKKTAAAFVDALCKIAYREAKKVGEFTIPFVGKPIKRQVKAGIRSNPATGETIQTGPVIKLPAKRVIKDSPMRGKFSRSEIRAAVQAVARRHGAT